MKGTKKYTVKLGEAINTEMLDKAIGYLEGKRIKGSNWNGMEWTCYTFFAKPSLVEVEKENIEHNLGVIISKN